MGPLKGLKIIEFAGVGPAPYAAMLFADMGAEVIRIDRPGGGLFGAFTPEYDLQNRSKKSICVDLKSDEGKQVVVDLLETADALVEGFRPGVMEKLGLGPDVCEKINPRLIYGRMTGWGQEGLYAQRAGHDINYISLTGALHAIGNAGQKPVVPLALTGDFAGSLMLVYGMMCALYESQQSGKGQVVDSAIIDATSSLMTSFYAAQQIGYWNEERGTNLLDSGAPFYDVYETADKQYIAFGAIESKFYDQLMAGLGLDVSTLPDQNDSSRWPELKSIIASAVIKKTQQQWLDVFEGGDACVTPVLPMSEAPKHPHNQSRNTFTDLDGVFHPTPAPRFSRSMPEKPEKAHVAGEDTEYILQTLNYSEEKMNELRKKGVVI